MTKKVRDYDKLAEQILQELGGEKNIISAARCATRLRLVSLPNKYATALLLINNSTTL